MKKNQAAAAGWSLSRRVVVSILVVLHIVAVFIPPFTFATSSGPGSASPFAEPLMRWLRPYIDLMFLDHGYFFFAPNPGPSHLLKAKLDFADGRPSQERMFPDRNEQWPRLLYHRHFMLAEQLHSEFVPPQPPPNLDPVSVAQWQRARDHYVQKRESFVEHLRSQYGASYVSLVRIEHQLMTPGEYIHDGDQINDPDKFVQLPEE